jgi:Ribbon-helix-helix protein, copG family
MAHRTQITLTDAQYEALRRESARTGLSLAELVRRALSAHSRTGGPDSSRALDASFGCWTDRDLDGAEYVERLRPGLGQRLLD